MNDELVRAMARRQDDVVCAWALSQARVESHVIARMARGWQELHDGVWLRGAAPPTRRQLWRAATLTAPKRYLSGASAAAAYGFRSWEGTFEIVTSRGTGGPPRFGPLLVCRSTTLAGNVGLYCATKRSPALPMLSPERVLAELAFSLGDDEFDRCVREALRLRVTTCARIHVMLTHSASRNRPAKLRAAVSRYARLPLHLARSDPEAYALALCREAGLPVPRINAKVAGLEADLSWPDRKLIIELDGPQFHLFPDEDLAKQAVWEAAGWRVERLPTDDVYDHPERLLALAAG